MRGLVGLFNLDGRPVALPDLQMLAAASRRPSAGGERFWISSSMGLGHLGDWAAMEAENEAAPFVSSSGVAVSLDGRIDNREELKAPRSWESGDSHRPDGDAAYVASAYDEFGEDFASRLNGDFSLALFDPSRHQLLLARDVMGARRLHYTQAGHTLLFASEIKSLLAYPGVTRAPDEDGLADLVLDRWIDPHLTCFRNIHSIPPGHLLVATPDGISVRRHWDFDPGGEIRYGTIDEYAGCFRALFEQAVRRRLRGPRRVAMTASGGLDSSSIFCQAAALARREPGLPALHGISMTFPAGSPADEQQFLDGIDAVTGIPVERVPIAELRILPDAGEAVHHLELPDLLWDAHGEIYKRARRAGCPVLLDGYYGDQALFPRRYLVDLARRGRWGKVHRDLREFGVGADGATSAFAKEFLEALSRSMLPRPVFHALKRRAAGQRAGRYPPWYTKAFVQRVLDRQVTRFESGHRFANRHAEGCYRDASAGHYLLHFQRQSAAAAMEGIDLASPFRDRDLLAYLMAIPGEILSWRGVPKGLLRQALSRVLPQPILNRRSKADFTSLLNRAALRDYDVIRQLLTRDCMAVSAGFVDGRLLEERVLHYKTMIASDDNIAVPAWRVTELAALELWLRRFFGPGTACTTS